MHNSTCRSSSCYFVQSHYYLLVFDSGGSVLPICTSRPNCVASGMHDFEETGLHLTHKREVGHSAITAYNGATKQVSQSTAHSKVIQPELWELDSTTNAEKHTWKAKNKFTRFKSPRMSLSSTGRSRNYLYSWQVC